MRHRRGIAALLLALAVVAALRAVAPPEPDWVEVTVAARDLPGGSTVASDDVTTARMRPGTAPDGHLLDPSGEVLATTVRRGEAITDTRVVSAALAAETGLVGLPVRLPDAGAATLLSPGDAVDLLAAGAQGAPASRLAIDVRVLAVVPEAPEGPAGGTLVVLEVREEEALRISGAAVTEFLSVTL